MEFDLCGCCNLRFLSMVAKTRNEFLSALSKSVARSRAIITVGSFNPLDNEYLPKIIAKAAGYNLAPIEKDELAIVGMGDYTLPETAIPLVTAGGVLGGAVLENSDQTIIMLTNDKDIRHSLLSDLVCPYIKIFANKKIGADAEISNQEITDFKKEENIEKIPDDASGLIDQADIDINTDENEILELDRESDSEKENLDDIDKILFGMGVDLSASNIKGQEEAENPQSTYYESENKEYTVLEKPEKTSNSYSTLEEFLAENEEAFDNSPKQNKNKIFRIIISIILVVAVLLTAYFGYKWYF
jgi:hypothetical protein